MIRTFSYTYNRTIFWAILILITYYLFKSDVSADIAPSFLTQGKDAQSSLGKTLKAIFEWALFIAAGLGAIGAAFGLAEVNGIIGQKEKGIEKIKIGLTVLAVSGSFLGIAAFFAGLGS
ncbi:MAG: hypothetical protein GY820_43490 [Gammaproteobacteria bacterium]|nr:hypothetical protein [Gammaproteobacteria bacterium]